MAKRLSTDERNRRTSAREVKMFLRKRPDRWFVYYSDDKKRVTTWTGETIGLINSVGKPYQPGCTRGRCERSRIFHVRVKAITGDIYNGTCVEDTGTYCRLRKAKGGR